ncbi:MAG TPA: cytochrome C oxidase subunit IV family protein [Acidimicrobiales bacterium]|nr:cytochrome C oxidase subunit IV family protein [Acidimicrobiales bacterium]
MATDTKAEVEAEHTEAAGHDEHAGHPTEGQYWKIFFILFAVTAVEVVLYYYSIPGVHLNNAALGILAIAKFIVVVGYFMHLKFDNRLLRRLFVTGLMLAVAVYIAYLLTMGVFISPVSERP